MTTGEQKSMAEIVAAVAERFRLDPNDLADPSRRRKVAWPRHIAMWLCLLDGTRSSPQVGRQFNRDHTSALYARNTVDRWISDGRPMGGHASDLAGAMGIRRGIRVVLPVSGLSDVKHQAEGGRA